MSEKYNCSSMEKLVDFVKSNNEFTIITHTSPDGDTLGSALAIYATLCALGKKAEVVCEYDVPVIYSFLPYSDAVKRPAVATGYKCAISVDCADNSRMGEAFGLFENACATANIDHHATNCINGSINVVDSAAAAVGELAYILIDSIFPEFDIKTAECLYTALMTDTGNFAYSNTTPRTHRIAASLLEKGVNNTELNMRIYRSCSLSKQRLLGKALVKLETHFDGLLAFTSVSIDEITIVGASEEDTEGIIDHVRDIDSVEIAVMVREVAENKYKTSFRSKRYIDVGKLSEHFGGGGHKRAAGCSVCMRLDLFKGEILQLAAKELKECGLWKA